MHPETNESITYSKLVKLIIDGKLPVGKFLSQRMLASKVNSAVVTIRCCLRKLENEWLIENIPRWGVRIPLETKEIIQDRYFMREILEIAAVRIIAAKKDSQHAEILRKAGALCDSISHDEIDGIQRFAEAHFAFHQCIAECNNSQLLVKYLGQLNLKSLLLWNAKRIWAKKRDPSKHLKFVEDLLSGSVKHAEDIMRKHVQRGLKYELEALDER